MKLDVFNHIFPNKFYERMLKLVPNGKDMPNRVREIPSIVDLNARFRIMDKFGDYAQIICLPSPPIEVMGPPRVSTGLAKLANDGMAELVRKYPKRFPAFVASLPMNDPAGLLREAERAITKLGAVGVQVFTNVLGKPLTAPETLPLFDLMAKLDLPIWLHPARGADVPDYKSEKRSHYEIWWTFGWPYEPCRHGAHGVRRPVRQAPELKVITHHMGGMIPFRGRVNRLGPAWQAHPDIDYTKLPVNSKTPAGLPAYHGHRAVGAWEATKCGLKFCPERVLFALIPRSGEGFDVHAHHDRDRRPAGLSPAERHAIYEGNARRLLKL